MSAELQAAVRKTLHSRAFERFIGLAVENALAEAARIEGEVKLLPPGPLRANFADHCGGMFFFNQAGDMQGSLFLRRASEESHGFYRNCHWYGTETRLDSQGRAWERSLNHLLTDDFGNLVEVPSP